MQQIIGSHGEPQSSSWRFFASDKNSVRQAYDERYLVVFKANAVIRKVAVKGWNQTGCFAV